MNDMRRLEFSQKLISISICRIECHLEHSISLNISCVNSIMSQRIKHTMIAAVAAATATAVVIKDGIHYSLHSECFIYIFD